jgi:hypothetical protein
MNYELRSRIVNWLIPCGRRLLHKSIGSLIARVIQERLWGGPFNESLEQRNANQALLCASCIVVRAESGSGGQGNEPPGHYPNGGSDADAVIHAFRGDRLASATDDVGITLARIRRRILIYPPKAEQM